jgi:transposase
VLKRLGLSYIIAAPYAYDAAPIELLFGYFKKVRIMPEGEKTGRK